MIPLVAFRLTGEQQTLRLCPLDQLTRHAVRLWKIRWREGGRSRSLRVHGSYELAKKIQRKKMSARDENRHLDVKREVNFRMTTLIDRYRDEYGQFPYSPDSLAVERMKIELRHNKFPV